MPTEKFYAALSLGLISKLIITKQVFHKHTSLVFILNDFENYLIEKNKQRGELTPNCCFCKTVF